jgi:surface protein
MKNISKLFILIITLSLLSASANASYAAQDELAALKARIAELEAQIKKNTNVGVSVVKSPIVEPPKATTNYTIVAKDREHLKEIIDELIAQQIYSDLYEITGVKFPKMTMANMTDLWQQLGAGDLWQQLGAGAEATKIERYLKVLAQNTVIDLNHIDVSNVTNMESLFGFGENEILNRFTYDVSQWDVSNVTNMEDMFEKSKFNGDISKWDVSKVKYMLGMFESSQFNGDISNWDVSNVTNMREMFADSQFNGDISKWDVSNVTEIWGMFNNSKFDGDISNWRKKLETDKRLIAVGLKILNNN